MNINKSQKVKNAFSLRNKNYSFSIYPSKLIREKFILDIFDKRANTKSFTDNLTLLEAINQVFSRNAQKL